RAVPGPGVLRRDPAPRPLDLDDRRLRAQREERGQRQAGVDPGDRARRMDRRPDLPVRAPAPADPRAGTLRSIARTGAFRASLTTGRRSVVFLAPPHLPRPIARARAGVTSMWKEFREFAMKGNVVDLAVGVIIGAAFGKIVTSLVEDIIMPA